MKFELVPTLVPKLSPRVFAIIKDIVEFSNQDELADYLLSCRILDDIEQVKNV